MSGTVDNPNPQVFKQELNFDDQFLTDRKNQERNIDLEDEVDALEGKIFSRTVKFAP